MNSYLVVRLFAFVIFASPGCARDPESPVEQDFLSNVVSVVTALSAQDLPVNTKKSIIRWKGTKRFFTAGHEGTVNLKEGLLTFRNNRLTGGTIVADMNTINITQTEESEKNRLFLINFLKTKEFNNKKYPFAIFQILVVKSTDKTDKEILVTGNLTIKDVTRQISIPAVIETTAEGSKRFYTEINLERDKWNIGIDGNLLEKNLVDNRFELKIELVTRKQLQVQ